LQRLDEHVDIEHVLLGVLDVEGTACQVLRRLGVDVAGLRRAVDSVPAEPAKTAEPQPVRVAGLSPRCPACGEVLATVLNHRVLTATDEAGTERDMVVAFCAACGAAIGATPI
jgi:hypothetical protein